MASGVLQMPIGWLMAELAAQKQPTHWENFDGFGLYP